MKKLFHAFFMSLSSFTRIPPLYRGWDEEAKKYMPLMLPFVGAIIGGLYFLLAYLLHLTQLPNMLVALCLLLFPYLITGLMHMDGFCDVVDAKNSYRSLEEKIRILKDPHIGSFGVLYAIFLILIHFVLLSVLDAETNYLFLIFLPIMSRIMSALSLTLFKKISVSEYNTEEDKSFKTFKIIYFIILLIAVLAIQFIFTRLYVIVSASIIVLHLLATLIANHAFKGINGDVSGYAISISEALSLISLVIMQVII